MTNQSEFEQKKQNKKHFLSARLHGNSRRLVPGLKFQWIQGGVLLYTRWLLSLSCLQTQPSNKQASSLLTFEERCQSWKCPLVIFMSTHTCSSSSSCAVDNNGRFLRKLFSDKSQQFVNLMRLRRMEIINRQMQVGQIQVRNPCKWNWLFG